jgi:two-component system response regulator HydG
METGCFQRTGAKTEMPTSARILATTTVNIEERVRAGQFREDLFYRLNVVELNVPPLRERRDDVLPLAGQFLAELTNGRAKLSGGASECLLAYAWPGNVRELRNAMERAALLSRGELVLPEHLPSRARATDADTTAAQQPLEEVEEQAILAALRKHAFNRTDTARALGISRRGLIYKLQSLRERGYKVDLE